MWFSISLKWPDNNTLTLGSVLSSSNSIVTLLGYGKVQWKANTKGQMEITMLISCTWAWTFKIALENIGSVTEMKRGGKK